MSRLNVKQMIAGTLISTGFKPEDAKFFNVSEEDEGLAQKYKFLYKRIIGVHTPLRIFNHKAEGMVFSLFRAPTEAGGREVARAVGREILLPSEEGGQTKIGLVGIKGSGKSVFLRNLFYEDKELYNSLEQASKTDFYADKVDWVSEQFGQCSFRDKAYECDKSAWHQKNDQAQIYVIEHPEQDTIVTGENFDVLIFVYQGLNTDKRYITVAVSDDSPMKNRLAKVQLDSSLVMHHPVAELKL